MDSKSKDCSRLLSDCYEGLAILGTGEFVSFRTAQHFVENCVYWRHPKSGWVPAPKHAERISLGPDGWELILGGNGFLVGLAVRKCIDEVSYFLKQVEFDDCPNYALLKIQLNQVIRESVANHAGVRYSGAYPESDDFMLFGTQGVYLPRFLEIVLLTSRLPKYFC